MCGDRVFWWETPRVCACVVCACGVLELIKQSGASVSGVFGKCVCVRVCFVGGMLLGI